jgi:large subunit ribosomal protein L18
VSFEKKKLTRTNRRAKRVRNALKSNAELPRVSVFRSLNHIYAQVIDMNVGKTVTSCSSLELKESGSKKEVARNVGKELAKRAIANGINAAIFDRGSYLYHGRVEELANGLRDGGLKI